MIVKYNRVALTKRCYDQLCPAAHALDLVGERWTLLLVRELLIGPRRYSDLLEGLEGIGTNLLAERLRRLEKDGLIRRRRLDPPAGSTVYELTERGAELEDVIFSLGRFGLRTMGRPRPTDTFRPEWLALTFRATFDPEAARGLDETYEFRVEGELIEVRVEDGRVEARAGAAAAPDLVIETDASTLVGMGTGEISPREAAESGAVRVEGKLETAERCIDVLGLSRP